jgi:hypothetical protein
VTKSDNPVLELRERLRLNQVKFSILLDRHVASVRLYEKHPEDVTDEMRAVMRSIAQSHGYADLAAAFATPQSGAPAIAAETLDPDAVITAVANGKYAPKHVIQPGETLISAGKKVAKRPVFDVPRLHGLLDEILDSGNPDAIQAVVPNLEVFAKYVRISPPQQRRSRG